MRIFLLPPDRAESSSPNAAKDGASIALTILNLGAGAASCDELAGDGLAGDGLAGSDTTVLCSFSCGGAGGAVTSFARAGAAPDPRADAKADVGFWVDTDEAAV